jgi:hypothetical protein
MPDFYAPSRPAPLDQADGLRRLFAGRRLAVVPLVANPFIGFPGLVLDRLAAVLAGQGRQVLVVDAAAASPPPPELAQVDLAAGIETVAPGVSYLPAAGLPLAYVDTRGCAGGFIDALQRAAPQTEVLLLHAEAQDLTRVLKRRAARPVPLAPDHPEGIKHAYAGAKLLAGRCGLLTFDLLLAAHARSPRLASIRDSLGGCAESFLGAVLCYSGLVDPADPPDAPADAALQALLSAQLTLDDEGRPAGPRPALQAMAAMPAPHAYPKSAQPTRTATR